MIMFIIVYIFTLQEDENEGKKRNSTLRGLQMHDTLREISFGSEFGNQEDKRLYRWNIWQPTSTSSTNNNEQDKKSTVSLRKIIQSPVRKIQVACITTPKNLLGNTQNAINEINSVVQGLFQLTLIEYDNEEMLQTLNADIIVHAKVPPAPFDVDNDGLFLVDGNPETCELMKAAIFINPEVPDHAQRHLILEELVQSFGLMNDTWTDKTSIFYQGWSDPDHLNPNDKKLLRQLYEDVRLWTGMTLNDYDKLFTS